MRKKILIFATLALVIFAAVLLVYPALQSRLVADHMSATLSDLRQLHLALQTYTLDSFSAGEVNQYPRSLQDLTRNNYLTEADLEKLTSSMKVVYTPPVGRGHPSAIILTGYSRHGETTVTVGGAMHFSRYP